MENSFSEIELNQAKKHIYSANLQAVIDRLILIDKWKEKDAIEAVKLYRNYLFLRKKYSQHNLPPSYDIDEAWHAHILHTKDYREFCKIVFHNENDQYLDHYPHMAKEGSANRLEILFSKTQELHKKEFGEYIYQIQSEPFLIKLKNLLAKLVHLIKCHQIKYANNPLEKL